MFLSFWTNLKFQQMNSFWDTQTIWHQTSCHIENHLSQLFPSFWCSILTSSGRLDHVYMRKSIHLLQRNTADIHDWICVFTPVLMVLLYGSDCWFRLSSCSCYCVIRMQDNSSWFIDCISENVIPLLLCTWTSLMAGWGIPAQTWLQINYKPGSFSYKKIFPAHGSAYSYSS